MGCENYDDIHARCASCEKTKTHLSTFGCHNTRATASATKRAKISLAQKDKENGTDRKTFNRTSKPTKSW